MAEAETRPQNDTADPLVGQVLSGRFSILEVIGTGGMGRVYKAVQAPLDRLVALKVLNPQYGGGRDPNFQKRFFLEASLTSRLRHPNTITVIDYGRTDDGIFYIAMEYVEGQTLAQVLSANGAFSWQRAMNITQQICRSLREAHKVGIIHRDLKPANVMVLTEETDHDQIKVLDFGLVKPLEGNQDAEITQAGMMLGSPLYMAPEMARHTADMRSDIYSLGVVTYQMLMGKPPFAARESVDAIIKHMREKPPPFAVARPDVSVPPEIEAVVMKCLEKDPAHRYQTMDELLEAVRRAGQATGASGLFSDPRTSLITSGSSATGSGPIPERTTPTPAPNPAEISVEITGEELRPRKPLAIMGAVFAVAVLAGGGAMWWAMRPSSAAPQKTPEQTAIAAPAPTSAPAPQQEDVAIAVPANVDVKVRFRAQTTPAGARAYLGDQDLGPTPVEFEVPRGKNGLAEATLTFTLDGYQASKVTARGEGPGVVDVAETLKKKAPVRKTTRPTDADKYKDDPYQ